MGIIEDIIARTLRRMERDLSEIKNIRRIDFVDLFPTSESHRKMLDEEAMREGKIIEETERGNVYLLNNPIPTKYGDLSFLKVRFFDETRKNWEAAVDFEVEDRSVLRSKVGKDPRFDFMVRQGWDAVEFKTNDALVYFVNPPASKFYPDRMKFRKIVEAILSKKPFDLAVRGKILTAVSAAKCSTKIYRKDIFFRVHLSNGATLEAFPGSYPSNLVITYSDNQERIIDNECITDYDEYLNLDGERYLLYDVGDELILEEVLFGDPKDEQIASTFDEYCVGYNTWVLGPLNDGKRRGVFKQRLEIGDVNLIEEF